MPKPKNNNASGLGRALANKRRRQLEEQLRHTTDTSYGKGSVTQESNLEDFLNSASLANTDFTAERQNVSIVAVDSSSNPGRNPYLLTPQQDHELKSKQRANRDRLQIPRRPAWESHDSTEEVDRRERNAFLDWRRSLAELQESQNLLLTPFERNLEVWRQLWRTVERSQLIVQIVDARNPLTFRCFDLERYVSERFSNARNFLLVNKADLLTPSQRESWANYFNKERISFAFFSATATAEQDDDDEDNSASGSDSNSPSSPSSTKEEKVNGDIVDSQTTRIFSTQELETFFDKQGESLGQEVEDKGRKITVGLVGYPNVGKSSTINALLGEKKVSVSATPGKTKHFQTIHLSPTIVLCDCPGLVFPQWADTNADMILDGILPIDQMRESSGPITVLTRRIPKPILEGTYGITIETSQPDQVPTYIELLSSHALARGFHTTGQGNPDQSRSARYVLKDYVSAKLLFAHPPPGIDADEFNRESRQQAELELQHKKKLRPIADGGLNKEPQIAMPEVGIGVTVVDKKFGTMAVDTGKKHWKKHKKAR